ncbi:hypothetical protein ACLOJK_002389 [Asimina triloba]
MISYYLLQRLVDYILLRVAAPLAGGFRSSGLMLPFFNRTGRMENTAILREWFQRVDSDRTGSITAPQLKFLPFTSESLAQSAFASGNLEFSVSVVTQMIRLTSYLNAVFEKQILRFSMYDFDRNGTMSFEEFVALNKFLLQVQNAFSALESSCDALNPD